MNSFSETYAALYECYKKLQDLVWVEDRDSAWDELVGGMSPEEENAFMVLPSLCERFLAVREELSKDLYEEIDSTEVIEEENMEGMPEFFQQELEYARAYTRLIARWAEFPHEEIPFGDVILRLHEEYRTGGDTETLEQRLGVRPGTITRMLTNNSEALS